MTYFSRSLERHYKRVLLYMFCIKYTMYNLQTIVIKNKFNKVIWLILENKIEYIFQFIIIDNKLTILYIICIGVYFNFEEDILTFGTVLKMRIVKHKHVIKKILCKAIDENRIEQKLKEINEV